MDKLTELLSELNITKNDMDDLCKSFDKMEIYDDRIELSNKTKKLVIYRIRPCGLEIKKMNIPDWIY